MSEGDFSFGSEEKKEFEGWWRVKAREQTPLIDIIISLVKKIIFI